MFKILVLVFLFPTLSWGADHYIRDGATGSADGSDWSNAWDDIPAALVRGDTYYIADGSYSPYVFNDAESGTEVITVKKASIAEHGTDTGWSNSYGDGEALFTESTTDGPLSITTGYWLIDGAYRTDISSGYGFRLINTTSTGTDIALKILLVTADNVTVQYLDIGNRGDNIADTGDDGIYAVGPRNNLSIRYCYIHDISRNGIVTYGDDFVFEYSYMKNIKAAGATHGQGLQIFASPTLETGNLHIRYNVFENIHSTATVAVARKINGVHIYGNVFIASDDTYQTSPATIVDVSESGEVGISNLNVHNNTFYEYANLTTGHPGIHISYTESAATNHVYNNLFINCNEIILNASGFDHDYNHFINSTLAIGTSAQTNESSYSEAATLVDSDNYNFRLNAGVNAIGAGVSLSTIYDNDPNGNDRGNGGVWDIGAYEYYLGGKTQTGTAYTQPGTGSFTQ